MRFEGNKMPHVSKKKVMIPKYCSHEFEAYWLLLFLTRMHVFKIFGYDTKINIINIKKRF